MNTLLTNTPIPEDIKATVRRTRSFGELVRSLSDEREAHLADLAAIDARADAWGARIDAACDKWNRHCARYRLIAENH